MAIFAFRTRSRDRDRDTDLQRHERILVLLETLASEMEAEASGLSARRDRTAADAAFALEAYENSGDARLSAKTDALTEAMINCSARLKELARQRAFLTQLATSVRKFTKGDTTDRVGEGKTDIASAS